MSRNNHGLTFSNGKDVFVFDHSMIYVYRCIYIYTYIHVVYSCNTNTCTYIHLVTYLSACGIGDSLAEASPTLYICTVLDHSRGWREHLLVDWLVASMEMGMGWCLGNAASSLYSSKFIFQIDPSATCEI